MATIRKLRGRWQAQVRRKGLAPRAKSFDTKIEAEKWARTLEAEVDRAGSFSDTRKAEAMTLASLMTRYRDEITPTKRSASTERFRIDALLKRDICHRTLAMLSSHDLARYRDERLKVVKPATVVREMNTISHAIDTARREWDIFLPTNPCKLVKRPAQPKGRQRRLKDGEEQRLLDAADAGRNPWMRSIIIIALETAMRRGEIVGLTWDDVDLDRRVANLSVTKNGESRVVPLSTRAVNELALLDRKGPKVFPVTESAVFQAWEHLRGRAGLTDLHFELLPVLWTPRLGVS
jgi:integrase